MDLNQYLKKMNKLEVEPNEKEYDKCEVFRSDSNKCTNHEKITEDKNGNIKWCPNPPIKTHLLTDADDVARSYDMCDECFESWVMG